MGGDPGHDPGHDPGISASPWVRVELRGGSVLVDGVPVEADGTPEGRYLHALQQVAQEVATPLGRRVGVTVTDGRGPGSHLAVHPDGTVDSLEELVRAAHAPSSAPPALTPLVPSRPVARATRSRRRLGVVAAALVVAATIVVVAPLLDGGGGDPAASGIGAPEAVGAEPTTAALGEGAAQAAAQRVVSSPELRLRVVLAPRATSTAAGEVVLVVPATPRAVRVEVRLVTSDGRIVVRRLRVAPGSPGRVVLVGLAPGAARWSVRAPGAEGLGGELNVLAPPPAPASPSQPASGGGGGGGGGKGGQPHADPVVPIDPDDQ